MIQNEEEVERLGERQRKKRNKRERERQEQESNQSERVLLLNDISDGRFPFIGSISY